MICERALLSIYSLEEMLLGLQVDKFDLEEMDLKWQGTLTSPSPKADKRYWNGLMSKKLGLGYGFTEKACFVCVNTARQNISSQAAATSTAKKVNTAKPIVNEIRPRNNFYKTHSPIRRPSNRTTTPKANFSNHKVNTAGDKTVSVVGGNREIVVKASAGCNWKSKRHYWNKVSKYDSGSNSSKNDDPQKALKNKGIVDSRCSRHMIRNKAYLVEYQDYNGGPVSFGGKLKQFNLFSVSQMCDKKNKVLFTDSECLVLSPDFKFPDENQVLLRVPRQNNMYSFNLENIVPTRGLACLIANATVDESNKWHRRMGHVFFVRTKDKTSGILMDFIRQIESQLNQKVKTIRCDNGTEFKNRDIIEFCGSKGIKREYSNARTPQQNGVAERKNMTLIEASRIMLIIMENLPLDHNEFALAAEAAPNNNNGWIEWDVPLGGEMDEPMVDPEFDEEDGGNPADGTTWSRVIEPAVAD
ncbi:ribonuclease H-like domain-containing protein [Tanacetum coccineum]